MDRPFRIALEQRVHSYGHLKFRLYFPKVYELDPEINHKSLYQASPLGKPLTEYYHILIYESFYD